MSVQSSANQCGLILGIEIGSFRTGPSEAVNSLRPSRLIFSSASEKKRRAASADDLAGNTQLSSIGEQTVMNAGNRTNIVMALRRNSVEKKANRFLS